MTEATEGRDRVVLFANRRRSAPRRNGVDDPACDVERFSLLRDYLGLELRTLLVLLGLVTAAFVVVTLIYGSIFGFRQWASNMHRAGSLMVINYCPSCGGAIPVAAPDRANAQTGSYQ